MSIIQVVKNCKEKIERCEIISWNSITNQEIAYLDCDDQGIIFTKNGTINVLYSLYVTTEYKNVDIESSLYINDCYVEDSTRMISTNCYDKYIFPYTLILPVPNIKIYDGDRLELIVHTNKPISTFCDEDDLKINSISITFIPEIPDVVIPLSV